PVVSPPHDSDVDLTGLHVTATSFATNGDSASTSATGNVFVDAVIDAPTLTAAPATGNEDHPVNLVINTAATDTDGSEQITKVVISGVPAGFSLNHGTDLGGGVWQLTQAQLTGLQLN